MKTRWKVVVIKYNSYLKVLVAGPLFIGGPSIQNVPYLILEQEFTSIEEAIITGEYCAVSILNANRNDIFIEEMLK